MYICFGKSIGLVDYIVVPTRREHTINRTGRQEVNRNGKEIRITGKPVTMSDNIVKVGKQRITINIYSCKIFV